MPRTPKLTPLRAFEDNLADAEALVTYARAFTNQRSRKMRRELRDRVGEALRIAGKRRDSMDCLESDDLFVVFPRSEKLGRERFTDLRPLLRQAIVAGCAALETYVADKIMESVGSVLRSGDLPKRLRDIPLTVGHWADIEREYSRRAWGIRSIVDEAVREMSSTSPTRLGHVLGIIGVEEWSKKLDRQRGITRGNTVQQLEAITERRNKIAHSADRLGQGRAPLEIEETDEILSTLREIAAALETVLNRGAA